MTTYDVIVKIGSTMTNDVASKRSDGGGQLGPFGGDIRMCPNKTVSTSEVRRGKEVS